MLKIEKNSILLGILSGLIIPFVGVAFLMMIDESIAELQLLMPNDAVYLGQKPRTLYLLALCLNLIPFQYFRSNRWDQSLRGIIFPTMAYALVWMIVFGASLLNNA